MRPLRPSNAKIFAHVRRYEDDLALCVHNLARSAQAVELDLSTFEGRHPEEMFGRTRFPRIGELPYLLTLGSARLLLVPADRAERDDERRCVTSPRRWPPAIPPPLAEESLAELGDRAALVRLQVPGGELSCTCSMSSSCDRSIRSWRS